MFSFWSPKVVVVRSDEVVVVWEEIYSGSVLLNSAACDRCFTDPKAYEQVPTARAIVMQVLLLSSQNESSVYCCANEEVGE